MITIELHFADTGDVKIVNPAHIETIQVYKESGVAKGSLIIAASGHAMIVAESPIQVRDLIQAETKSFLKTSTLWAQEISKDIIRQIEEENS